MAEREGEKPNYRTKTAMDFAYENIKAVYRYLEAIKTNPQATPPVLKDYREGESKEKDPEAKPPKLRIIPDL
ncbi:hypothetical protein [Peribacillus frigoritolerans]|uniref:hypothetical protein n=1 Tax=Peribacillus frigoritolerans TaxID=450367 RepID=UPI0024C1B836|nr:hypothetical protein [Peribacillus frigoritolerans]WHX62348.1 hypothetical protein QNH33_01680 [Peribacillus frigoritolerans]